MSPSEWTTDEQATFLQSYFSEYLTHTEEKRYHRFWPKLYAAWFAEWPERKECFPEVTGPLTPEQNSFLGEEIESRKLQLRTWFRWRTNASRMNRMESSTSCKTSVFARFLNNQKPSRSLSEVELFMQEYYDEKIKPCIKADKEAGRLTSRGEVLKAARKLAKKLLKEADDATKKKIKTMYELQKKQKAEASESAKTPDPATIGQAIDQLPYALAEIAALIRQCCGFAVSFYCAGPDPSKNWEITSIACHPDVTSQGNTFAQLHSGQDAAMVSAFHDFAETLFPVSERGPISAESSSDHLVSNHNGEDGTREGEIDETVQETKYFEEGEGSQGFTAHDSGLVFEEDPDDDKTMLQNQENAFENIDLSDALLGVGDAWVTAPCDASYGLNNAEFYTHTQPPMSNIAMSQFATGSSVPVDNFQNSTSSHDTTAGSSAYTAGFSNSAFAPSWDYSSLYSFPDPATSNVRSMIGDGPEGVGEVRLPPVPTHFGTDGPCLPAPTAHFGISQPHSALPTLPAPPQPQPTAGAVSDMSLPTKSKTCSKVNKRKAPIAPTPITISQGSVDPSVDMSLTATKRRPRPRVVHHKASVPGPVENSGATTPMVPMAPKSADQLPRPVPPVKNCSVTAVNLPTSLPAVQPAVLPSENAPCVTPHNTAMGVDTTESIGPRASKRVPKKSTRNEEANAIGTNGPGSSQLPSAAVSRKGKRAAGGVQGRPSKYVHFTQVQCQRLNHMERKSKAN